ncbi:hypothetical protein GCM10010363_38430 [Streptomyces omiyaensis]|uniref:hypothetical protein n=1 Tax=Streptomyces omiyaensis TaxID=68247 RepID=UPI001675DC9C|nr:hypothetical protein [Streptomyces omiyaensis]GGY53640.1 hypothetical protein GCM10010363_38430 [Streptomyces omiyaensis]
MSASDQSTTATESPAAGEPDETDGPGGTATPGGPGADGPDEQRGAADGGGGGGEEADSDSDSDADADSDAGTDSGSVSGEDDAGEDDEDDDEDAELGDGMTPRQARRLRVAAASVLLVVMGVVLVIRLASRTSVLVVGVYGLAMILCGIVIELARNGRTRLGTWLLVGGLTAALAFDWLILP